MHPYAHSSTVYASQVCTCHFLHARFKLFTWFPIDVRPLIETEDEESYAAVAGSSAFLRCEFFASPQAMVSW